MNSRAQKNRAAKRPGVIGSQKIRTSDYGVLVDGADGAAFVLAGVLLLDDEPWSQPDNTAPNMTPNNMTNDSFLFITW
jgi:hypothetical protein